MTLERILLQSIKFDLQLEHPYRYLLKYANCLKGEKSRLEKMVQMAWNFVNDSLCTTLCLQWEPEIIAIALMYLACKLSKFDVVDWSGRESDHLRWWDMFVQDMTIEVLEDICHQVLDFYSQAQAQQAGNEKQELPPVPSLAIQNSPGPSTSRGLQHHMSTTQRPCSQPPTKPAALLVPPPTYQQQAAAFVFSHLIHQQQQQQQQHQHQHQGVPSPIPPPLPPSNSGPYPPTSVPPPNYYPHHHHPPLLQPQQGMSSHQGMPMMVQAYPVHQSMQTHSQPNQPPLPGMMGGHPQPPLPRMTVNQPPLPN